MKLRSIIRKLEAEKKAATTTIARLTRDVEQIESGIAALTERGKRGRPPVAKRRVSAATRRKMRLAAKKRWAKRARTQPKAEVSA